MSAMPVTIEHTKKPRGYVGAYNVRHASRRETKGNAALGEGGGAGKPRRSIHEIEMRRRGEVVSRWLDRLRLPDLAAAMVLDDAARRYAIAGLCMADPAHVSDVLPDPAAYRRCLRMLEAVGLITLQRGAIIPSIGVLISPAAWRDAALALNRPAQPRACR
ncbi:hypothetical protein ACYQR9_23070 [Methylobacterium sp. CM6241]